MTGNDLDYLLGTLERLRDNTAVIPRDHEDAQAYLRAIVDHTERREREAQAEAEQGGVVLLEARDLQADIRLFKDNRLLRFKPQLRLRIIRVRARTRISARIRSFRLRDLLRRS